MPMQQPDLSVFTRLAPTVPIEGPADWQKQAADAQAAQALAQQRRDTAQKAADERADAQLLQQLAQETGGDPHQMSTRLRATNPRLAMKFDEDWGKVQTANATRLKALNENDTAITNKYLGRLKMIEGRSDLERPALWASTRAEWLKDDPEMEPYLPTEIDPQKAKALYAMGLDAAKINEYDAKSLQYRVEGKWMASTAMAFADHTMDAQEVAATAKALKDNGYPPDIVDSFDWQHWTPDFAARALEMGRTPEQKADAAAKAAEHADTVAHQQATEANAAAQLAVSQGNLAVARQNANRLAAQPAGGTGGRDRDDLIEAVIANPGLYDQITPTERGKIAGELQRRGFVGFGRPLSEGAAKQLAMTDAASASLVDLREILKKNEQYLGPIAGLAALNPYSDARKAQADIDLVRQRVGKALEGGVLCKEDEEKYKQILATLRDTPDTAIYKVDQLIKDLERDKAAFVHQQRLTGRRVPQGETPTAATTAAPAKKVNPFRK